MSLRISEVAGVALVELDRPPVNAMDLEMVLAMETAFLRLQDQPTKGLVLGACGRAFSAGVDTRAFAASSPQDKADLVVAITRMITALYGLPFPVVSAIGGHAMGGGFVLMLASDVRIAADDPDARLGLQEAAAGIPFPAGPLEVIRAELSPDLLRRLTLTSVALSPASLEAQGVIDELTPVDELRSRALARADQLSKQPAFAAVKHQVRAATLARLTDLVTSGLDPLAERLRAG